MQGAPIFAVQVVLALLTYSLLGRWYVAPRLRGLPKAVALQPLLAVHAFRYIGLVFIVPTVVKPALPQSFAVPAAIGTAIAGCLALAAIAALRTRPAVGIVLAWVWSVEGLADFANAFFQAHARAAEVIGNLGGAYYVPIVIVPAALVTHFMALGVLIGPRWKLWRRDAV